MALDVGQYLDQTTQNYIQALNPLSTSLVSNNSYSNGGTPGVNFWNTDINTSLQNAASNAVNLFDGVSLDASGSPSITTPASASSPSSTTSVFSTTFWTNIFLRLLLAVLGFIFIAGGLALFSGKSIPTPLGKLKAG